MGELENVRRNFFSPVKKATSFSDTMSTGTSTNGKDTGTHNRVNCTESTGTITDSTCADTDGIGTLGYEQ